MYGQGAVICPVTPVYHVQPSETVVTKVRQHVYSIASIIFDQKSFLKKKNKAYMGENFKKSCLPLIVVAFMTEIFYISKIFFFQNLRWDVGSSLVCNFITFLCFFCL